jgi:hypothetical protein
MEIPRMTCAPEPFRCRGPLPSRAARAIAKMSKGHNVCEADREIKRRFHGYEIPPVDPVSERELMERALATYSAAVGIEYPVEPDIIDRLLHGLDNRLGRSIEIMLDALRAAIEAGHPRLDMQHFAEAWGRNLECPRGANVFVVENWPDVDPVRGFDRAPSAPPAPLKRPRGRK